MATTRTVSLRSRLKAIHSRRRLKQAIRYLRTDIAKHSKVGEDRIRMSKDLNRYVMVNTRGGLDALKITIEKTGDKMDVDLAPELKPKAAPLEVKKEDSKKKGETGRREA